MRDISKNVLTRIRGPTTFPPFEAGATVKDHMILLTKPSVGKVNIPTGLSTVEHL